VRRALAALLLPLLLAAGLPQAAADPAGRSQRLTSDAVADLARAWVLEQFGPEVETSLDLVSQPRDLVLPRGDVSTRVRLQAGSPSSGWLTALVEAVVTDGAGQRTARSGTVAFRVNGQVEVVVAARELPRGHVVAAGDVRRERRPAERLARGIVSDPGQAVGKEVVRAVAPGEPLAASALAPVRVIKRGAAVQLLLEGPGFVVSARGIAAEDGSVGQTIKVINQSSRKPLAGKVEDAHTVRVPF
jgi:flagella basal body P-ring formation protein FlgA